MFGLFKRRTSIIDSGYLEGGTDSHCHILYGVDGSTFSIAFYVTIAAAFLACLLSLIAGIVKKGKYALQA